MVEYWNEAIAGRKARLERRCRIWLFGGFGLMLAGMAVLVFHAQAQRLGWALILAGIAGRVMHYLDHLSLRTLRHLQENEEHTRHRQELPPKQ